MPRFVQASGAREGRTDKVTKSSKESKRRLPSCSGCPTAQGWSGLLLLLLLLRGCARHQAGLHPRASSDEGAHHGPHAAVAAAALRLGPREHVPEAQRLITRAWGGGAVGGEERLGGARATR